MYVNLGFANIASFPVTGAADTIYTDLSNKNLYTWNGSAYVSYMPTKVTVATAYKPGSWFTANPTLLLFEGQRVDLSDGAYEYIDAYAIGDGITELQNLPWKGVKENLAQTLAIDNKTGGLDITSDDQGAALTLTDENNFGLSNSNGGISVTPTRTQIDHTTEIILQSPSNQVSQDATAGLEIVSYQQWQAAFPANKISEEFIINGPNLDLSHEPTFIYGLFKEGQECRIGSSGAEIIADLNGIHITFNDDYTGQYFKAVYEY